MKITDLDDYHVVSTGLPTQQTNKPGMASRVGSDLQNRGNKVNDIWNSDQSQFSKKLQTAGQGAAFATDIAVEAVKGISDATGFTEKVVKPLGKASKPLGIAILETPLGKKGLEAVKGGTEAYQAFKTKYPEAAGDLEAIINIGSILPIGKGASVTAEAGKNAVINATSKIKPATSALIDKSSEIIKPRPSAEKALGEVLQGKTKDLNAGKKALGSIDTGGVTTFKQLQDRIDQNIADYSKSVDDILDMDSTPKTLESLGSKTVSGGGKEVSRNFIQTAIAHLDELYRSTADDARLADLQDVIEKANKEGLTAREVNDISRMYNTEFGSKAFSKTGDPLTSVNAQMYENIRKGVKDIARQGMGGSDAAATDKIISSLYNTRKLVEKNVEAVNKLKQRISERGLLEKIGHAASKYADILSGGSIRGFIGGILPRGAGYKVMNALDLEERLSENLEIIRKAMESGSDNELIKALDTLQKGATPTPKVVPVSSPNGKPKGPNPQSGSVNFFKKLGNGSQKFDQLQNFIKERTQRLDMLRAQGMSENNPSYKAILKAISDARKKL